MASKERERALIEKARRACNWFPAGALTEDESPDFLLDVDGGRLGVEVTELFQPAETHYRVTPRARESFHRRVVSRADELHRAAGHEPLDVLVYFGEEPLPQGVERAARLLVDFVLAHPPRDGCETFNQGAYARLSVVRIAHPLPGHSPTWEAAGGGHVPVLCQGLLGAAIAAKNVLVPRYRDKADHVWLLITLGMFPASAYLSVPHAVAQWGFPFDFDKVLLYSDEDGILELRRSIDTGAERRRSGSHGGGPISSAASSTPGDAPA